MKHWKLCGTTAMVTIFAATGAFADVTPEEVWQNWQDTSTSYGQTIASVSAERDGDTLVVSGVTMDYDKEGATFSGAIEEINFTDNGDGTVSVTMSDSYPLTLKVPADADVEGSEPADLKITLTQPGMEMIASGTVESLSYKFTAPTMVAKLEAIDGVDAAAVNITAEAAFTNMSGGYVVEGDPAARTIASDFGAESVDLSIVGTDVETKSDFNMTAKMANVAGKSNGTFLGADAMANLAEAVKAGFAVEGSFSHGGTSFDVTVTEENGPTKIAGTSEGGETTFAMNAEKLQYGGNGKAVALTLSSPDIPFPELKLAYQETAFNLIMPVSKSDVPGDFALLTKIVGFSISDEVWGMFDPAGTLPHDPATIIIDTKGKARMTTDLFDEVAMAALGEAPPGELHALDINEVKVSVAGAELTGVGGFTFDNTDTTTFDGVPLPTGKLDVKLTGGNTLVDKIVAMGLISQDDAMGAKMMVSMFANSAADKDEMTSTLEFKDKGFYANGQKLQ